MTYITTKEAAAILEMHVNSVMYHVKHGNLPAFRLFNEWRFDPITVFQFKEEEKDNGQKVV